MFNFHFRWIPWRSFPQPKNQINKPASNNRRILIAALAAVDSSCISVCSLPWEPAWTITNADIDQSLYDAFVDEKLNEEFSFENRKRNSRAVVFHFVEVVQEHHNFKTSLKWKIGCSCWQVCRKTNLCGMLHKFSFINSPVKILTKRGRGEWG